MIMKEDLNIKSERSMLVPFLVGGVVGAGIALLLAPKSGKDLRKDITDIASDTRKKVATTIEKGKELYATTIDKGRELYADSTAAVKNAFEAGKVAYVEEMEKHRKAV
jgi:gas vesicle protein